MSDEQDSKFINDVMVVVDAYLNDDGDASLLVNYFATIAEAVQKQIIDQEGERPTLH